jgi:hypothetical protein
MFHGPERWLFLASAIYLICVAGMVFKLLYVDRVRILRDRERVEMDGYWDV